jgi:acyl-coenzyme A thioesterase PaaI-like protein
LNFRFSLSGHKLTLTRSMHVTEIAIHKLMGMRLAAAGEPHILELPESTLLLNHLDSIHAGVQFALAEACSGEFLLRHFGYGPSEVFAVLRRSKVKFCRPAHGNLRASARLEEKPGASAMDQLASRGHAFVAVFVEVMDANGVVTMNGRYDWFLRRHSG